MKGPKGAALVVAIMLAASACGGYQASSQQTPGSGTSATPQRSAVSAGTVSSTGLILDGRVRCTATVSRSVQVGSVLGLTFAVRNISDRPVKVPLARSFWLVVSAADGTTYDTRVPMRNEIGGPFILPTPIPPGGTKTVAWPGKYLPVRWPGPLQIAPGCEKSALPVLRVGVESPGPPADEHTAVASVVAASGHLLDHCRPEQTGVAVQGQIYSPDGKAPPMSATCSVSLQSKGQFVTAQALIVSPADLSDVQIGQPYEQLSVHHAASYEAVAWEFVVTKDGATSVAATEADATKAADHMAPDWSWTSSGPQDRPGGSRCGGWGTSGGGSNGPTVEFVTVCPA